MAASPAQDLSNLLYNPLYPLHGPQLPFSPAQASHGAIAGLYQPSQTIAPPSNTNNLLQQSQATETAIPASGAYQQPQLAQLNWNTNYWTVKILQQQRPSVETHGGTLSNGWNSELFFLFWGCKYIRVYVWWGNISLPYFFPTISLNVVSFGTFYSHKMLNRRNLKRWIEMFRLGEISPIFPFIFPLSHLYIKFWIGRKEWYKLWLVYGKFLLVSFNWLLLSFLISFFIFWYLSYQFYVSCSRFVAVFSNNIVSKVRIFIFSLYCNVFYHCT